MYVFFGRSDLQYKRSANHLMEFKPGIFYKLTNFKLSISLPKSWGGDYN